MNRIKFSGLTVAELDAHNLVGNDKYGSLSSTNQKNRIGVNPVSQPSVLFNRGSCG